MYSAARQDDLKILECFLQDALHAHLGRIVPFRVKCAYKENTLWVLAQHPADVAIDVKDTFQVLGRALQSEQPQSPLPVKLFLRSRDREQPYAQDSFTVYPLVKTELPGEASPELAGISQDLQAERLQLARTDVSPVASPLTGGTLTITAPPPPPPPSSEMFLISDDDARIEPSSGDVSGDLPNRIDTDAFAEDIERSFGFAAESYAPEEEQPARGNLLTSKKALIAGGVGALLLGAGATYMGTRPCSMGACPELGAASQVIQNSIATVNKPGVTGQEILSAQSKMRQGVDNLKSIPAWSGSYGKAQDTLKQAEPESTRLDTAVTGMNRAYEASKMTQKLPLDVTKWQQSKKLWQEAITNLQQVPNNSQIYPLVQQKLQEYQGKLGNIDRRIEAETKAEKDLQSAIEGSKIATAAQKTAITLTEWKSVKSTWERVNGQITSVPSTTTSYTQAQALQKSYQPLMATSQQKVQEEEKANQNYTNAVRAAQAAKTAQVERKLDIAVAEWNKSVTAIQSIPQTSTIYGQAKPLILEYTRSFQQAETELKNTRKIGQATKDLQRTCGGSNNLQICSYIVNDREIVVRLLPVYTQQVRQTGIAAANSNDRTAKIGVIDHVVTLGNALQTISDNAKLPISVVDSNGKTIQTYRPPS
jgi:hypothetical protein